MEVRKDGINYKIIIGIFLSFAAMMGLASATTILEVIFWMIVWAGAILGVMTFGMSAKESMDKIKYLWN